jgi:hypothetical protein
MADLNEKAFDEFVENMRNEICKTCGIPKEFLEAPIPRISDEEYMKQVTALMAPTPTETLEALGENQDE